MSHITSSLRAAASLAVVTLCTPNFAHAVPFTYSTDFSAGVGAEWNVSTSYNNGDAGILGQLADGSATLSVNALLGGTSSLDFDLLGFRTIDGYNCCTDRFSLSLNGTEVFRGVFSLGGGGSEGIEVNTLGAVVSGSGTSSRHIAITSLNLLSGVNTLGFTYGGLQGYNDEAWGLDNVAMAGEVSAPSAVPEPAVLGLFGIGLLGLGFARRRA